MSIMWFAISLDLAVFSASTMRMLETTINVSMFAHIHMKKRRCLVEGFLPQPCYVLCVSRIVFLSLPNKNHVMFSSNRLRRPPPNQVSHIQKLSLKRNNKKEGRLREITLKATVALPLHYGKEPSPQETHAPHPTASH